MSTERVWPRPVILPLPEEVSGCEPKLLLNGDDWEILREFEGNPWDAAVACPAGVCWEPVTVPMQQPPTDKEYAYKKTFTVPAAFAGKRVFLRFDGVNCDVRIYIQGKDGSGQAQTSVHPAGSHYGGFVAWNREITDFVTPGEEATLYVVSHDDPGGVCPFQFGGIIRDVTLFALPKTYLARFHALTDLDAEYKNATLSVMLRASGGEGCVKLTFVDPEGNEVTLTTCGESDGPFTLPCEEDVTLSFPVASPKKWDAEHPYLYTLTAELLDTDGNVTERTTRRIGFRKIEKRGKQIFLNGKVLKLRGINHHDIYPKSGKAITKELAEIDVKLFKEANINFVRTSHYPPRPDFLDFCDEYGIYIEDETAVAFLGQGVDCRENDPAFTEKIMQPFAEFLERDLSHPSVILWSLANECFWGTNLALENAYAHQEDPSRLTIFSYPITQKEDDDRADIWSMHYAGWDQAPDALVDSFNRSCHEPVIWPVLHDESTHIPCYARNDLRRDPGIRDFYGETISRFWDKLWDDEASLGCAIWAGIDDVWENGRMRFMSPSWGIIDGYRRKKPEHWHVRKAYAPVRLRGCELADDGLLLTLENRFNHTDLSEVTVRFKAANAEGAVRGPQVPPRSEGQLLIPLHQDEDAPLDIALSFFDAWGNQVQEEAITAAPGKSEYTITAVSAAEVCKPEVKEDENSVCVSGPDFEIRFCKKSGLIREAKACKELVLCGGPSLHLTGLPLAPWVLQEFSFSETEDGVCVRSIGAYGKVRVQFEIVIDGCGRMETTYTILDMPYASPRKLAMRIGDDTDSGGYEEVGIRFTLPADVENFFWKKQGLWSVFPEDHIGRLEGEVPVDARGALSYSAPDLPLSGVQGLPLSGAGLPTRAWKDDFVDPLIFGPYDVPVRGSRDLRSLKSTIFEGGVTKKNAAFTVLSEGNDSLRLFFRPASSMIVDDRDERLSYSGNWRRMETGFGSLNGTESWSDEEGASCTLRFNGTGVAWIGSMDILGGIAEVLLDGEVVEPRIMLGTRLLTPGIARGYEKDPQRLLYAKEGLAEGEHTLTIRVTGQRTPGSSGAYVFIDHFVVLGNEECWIPELVIDSAFNYPELSWGCYTKEPVRLATGDVLKFVTCLGAR